MQYRISQQLSCRGFSVFVWSISSAIPFFVVSFLRVLPLDHSGQNWCKHLNVSVLTSKILAAASALVLWKFIAFWCYNFTQLKNNRFNSRDFPASLKRWIFLVVLPSHKRHLFSNGNFYKAFMACHVYRETHRDLKKSNHS